MSDATCVSGGTLSDGGIPEASPEVGPHALAPDPAAQEVLRVLSALHGVALEDFDDPGDNDGLDVPAPPPAQVPAPREGRP
ncbi:hypothetical protein [Pseudonocardia nigra]|uniref:hypothetical protein n=1 Tax=Pseudonocardia nigra TaxID=1921578 RepID=UPI001C5D85E5|nr:hypothetical protein [Pseudonocardia nigra]